MTRSTIIRTLIVDDEASSRNILQKLLRKFCPNIKIVGVAASIDEAYQLFIKGRPQLLFLDVEMPNGTGFDLLMRLPHHQFEVIFVTGFDHYALKAIKYHVLDYLLKPIDIDELTYAVRKAENALLKQADTDRLQQLLSNIRNTDPSTQSIAIPTIDGREFIRIEQIIYCQADGSYTWIHLDSEHKLLSSRNLGEYEKLLPKASKIKKHSFFRIHYAQLINLFYIKKYNSRENYVQMSNGDKVNIAQRRKSGFLEIMKV
ncbi:MAG: LytTR family DNA-binding domain-containing protein [Chitinophagales bacterium]|nr:LytTR family DNA-binding domain-containing protein [Chitinophagales bacterium]